MIWDIDITEAARDDLRYLPKDGMVSIVRILYCRRDADAILNNQP